ncbi:Septation protein imp2 [Psilocybe cubensis]|uniref:Septation protein imp2 n=2 Tax=Psilocybe cubensis TaxID=181762 RepID=A0A8H8CNK4_PSICU|nr:Septation protein imp2 [Psilocybe cubensis]KAH9485635.1 Septation protein imp2 [Psilocybe cubensis]
MSARRQPSTTSLSKFARTNSPISQNRSLDFCNSFWGIGDGGVDVLFARMRGATRTMEELKVFWKERAAIEDEYAKRLAKLAKMTLGRDEIGELRNSLDTVRLETDRQAGYHLNLSQQIRTELEGPAAAFHARQLHHKKTYQTTIEKEFKTKQTQESYVNKAREKYEQDCLRINSFTAQASLVQGKDLEKIQLKLERTQQTVQTNEREFASFSKALQDTVQKWEQDWKSFCDSCQDLEEQRMEFMKDNIWGYANAVSTVCVADDESCEHIRVALEQVEPDKDMENFVRDYGTGNQIPDPPAFVNYQAPDAIPSSSARPTSRIANFARATTRELPLRSSSMPPDDEPSINTAGIGAGGGGTRRADSYISDSEVSRQPTRNGAGSSSQSQQPHINGNSSHHATSSVGSNSAAASSQQAVRRQSTVSPPFTQQQQLQRVLQDPHAETIDPTAETYIKVGNQAYKVDLNNDPQQQASGSSASRQNTTASPSKQNGGVDPLMKQLEELKNAVSTSGSVRRNTLHKPKTGSTGAEPKPGHASTPSISSRSVGPASSSLSLPGGSSAHAGGSGSQNRSPSPARDYRNSAEIVVGAHPSASRPVSPAAPTAAFMLPKSGTPVGAEIVQEVLADYQQSLPGERKSISRSNSVNREHAHTMSQGSIAAPANAGQNLARPPSQLGHAGIGAHGGSRSNSPQPISRGPSPAPNNSVGITGRNSLASPTQAGPGVARAPSPNTVGIALDPSGRVLHDEMAQRYQQQQQLQQQQQQHQIPRQVIPPQTVQPTYQPPPPPVQQQPSPIQQQPVQRRNSYVNPLAAPVQGYAGMTPPPPPQAAYQTPSPQPSYVQQQQQQSVPPVYNQPPAQQYQVPPQQQQQQRYGAPQQQQPQQQAVYGNMGMNGVQRGYYGNQTPPQQQPVQQVQQQGRVVQQQQQQPQQLRGYQQQQQQPSQLAYARDPSPVGRSPSPQPPPQITDDGSNVLFYVKALYDYTATIDEEFDFQAGDIIAVTATPEDGWWSGELLDEARRQKGRNVFPSNFVCLF